MNPVEPVTGVRLSLWRAAVVYRVGSEQEAVDFVTKPEGEVSANLSLVRDELIAKLCAAAGANLAFRAAVPASARDSRPGVPRKLAPAGLKPAYEPVRQIPRPAARAAASTSRRSSACARAQPSQTSVALSFLPTTTQSPTGRPRAS